MQPNTNTKLLLYMESAAAVSSSLSRKADGSTLAYYEAIGGFPGIWKLSARAGIALQDALNHNGDPDTKDVDFLELVGGMVNYLLNTHAEPSDDELRQQAEELIEQTDEDSNIHHKEAAVYETIEMSMILGCSLQRFVADSLLARRARTIGERS